MLRKMATSTLVVALAVILDTTGAEAGKPVPNEAPLVTVFDVADNSASPIPVQTFIATDVDGTVDGYLITESSSKPSQSDPGWTVAPPTQYLTSAVGTITLYAWAKDNGGDVSGSLSDTVTIPMPPVDADTLDGRHAVDFALAGHVHDQTDVTGLTGALAAKADVTHIHGTADVVGLDSALAGKAATTHAHAASDILGTIGVERLATFSGVRIVHKGAVDNQNSFNTIAAALASLGNTASNNFAVVVMPGVYTENLTVPENVALVGADKNAVILDVAGTGGVYDNGVLLRNAASLSGMTVNLHGDTGYGIRGENVTIEGINLNMSDEGGIGTLGINVSGKSIVRGIRVSFAPPVTNAQKIGICSETHHAGDDVEIRDVVMVSDPAVFNNVYGFFIWGFDPTGVTALRDVSLSGYMIYGVFARGGNIKVFDSSFSTTTGTGINYTLTTAPAGTLQTLDVFGSEVGSLQIGQQASLGGSVVARVYSSILQDVSTSWALGSANLAGSEIRGSLSGNIKALGCFDRYFDSLVFP